MCQSPEMFIKQTGALVLAIREAVTKLAEFGQDNPGGVACHTIRWELYKQLLAFQGPLQEMNEFVVLYAQTHGAPVPKGFETAATMQITDIHLN
jgi:hypothetical protein